MINNSRQRTAIKRSVHFVLTNAFADSIVGVGKNFTRDFWRYLDDKNSATRKIVRKKAYNVWKNSGEDVLSSNFTQGSLLVVTKRGSEISLGIKEVAGELTEINKVIISEPIDDEDSVENDRKFEEAWNKLSQTNGEYPTHYRPLTSPVAQMIASRVGAPLPVVCAAISSKFMPSDVSNGFTEMAKKSMPKEVFEEALVNRAIENGVAERVGPANSFTFKVKRDKYREWIAMVQATNSINLETKSIESEN